MYDKPFDAEACDIGGQASATPLVRAVDYTVRFGWHLSCPTNRLSHRHATLVYDENLSQLHWMRHYVHLLCATLYPSLTFDIAFDVRFVHQCRT
jgi:hypothetical protein